ncbi:MFS transporter, DHA1 family, bicyclomycin/chloramphenicol resistance protein [Paenibacillus sp. yr247]|uniref:multidrug effflux MFS transporter n=1 Tax=Paenibacillus sp. yr247 TaxID=1761880 RepID=UPI00087F90B0|nr:multidrug effflux MFS transporter [Paenibacillus sp. yr247]SDN41037.1 MFS transporter, DHA1 family, bicyclomycin/chloramphenicol resistance protein [Paenibacillus sp. yr247]
MSNQIATQASLSSSRVSRLWIILVLGSLASFGPLSLDMYLPALPNLANDLHTNTSLAQMSLTACMLGMSIGQLIAGSVSDVRGRRIPLLIGLVIYAISSLLCMFSPSIWIFLGLRFVQGLAGAAGIVISRAIVRDMYEGVELTKFFALLMLVNGVAPILAPIIGGQILQFTSWRGVFLMLSLIGVLMLIAATLGLKETHPPERRSKGGLTNTLRTFRGLLTDRMFMGYALTQGLVFAGMFAYISGSPFVLQDIFGVSPQMFSVCFAINGLGIIIAGQVTGRLAGKVSGHRLLAGGLALAAFGGMLLFIATLTGAGLYAILAAFFFIVSSVGPVSVTTSSLALQNQGKSAGSAAALLGLLSFIIGGAIAPLVGIGGSQTAVPLGIIIALMEIGAILCFVLLTRKKASAL